MGTLATLVLLRHAKSAYPVGVPDHERPLNGRGRRDAPVAGKLIDAAVGPIDVAVVSSAARAQQTYALAAAALRVGQRRDDPALYLASPGVMLDRIADERRDSLLLVAHNPGIEELAALLIGNASTAAIADMSTKFPTAAYAVLRSERPWHEWGPGCAELAEFRVARG